MSQVRERHQGVVGRIKTGLRLWLWVCWSCDLGFTFLGLSLSTCERVHTTKRKCFCKQVPSLWGMTAWPFAHTHYLQYPSYPQPFGPTPASDTPLPPCTSMTLLPVSGVRSVGLPLAGLALLASQGCSQVADWVQEGSPPELLQQNIRALVTPGPWNPHPLPPPASGRCQADRV